MNDTAQIHIQEYLHLLE